MTISIDPELRGRIQEYPEVNWSEVARDAFKRRIEDMENAQNMELSKETVARLVGSRERAENEERSLGYKSGKRWAASRAEWSELRDLAAEVERWPDADAWDNIWSVYKDDHLHEEITEWLESYLGERYSEAMLAGFLEGAIAVYEAMQEA